MKVQDLSLTTGYSSEMDYRPLCILVTDIYFSMRVRCKQEMRWLLVYVVYYSDVKFLENQEINSSAIKSDGQQV